MCIRLNKLAQVKLSSATLKTNICGTQTLVKYQHYHHHQHHHYHQHQYSQQYQQLTPQLESPLNCSATRLQFLAWLRSFLLLLSILRLCLWCATCHLSSETWYNLSQSTNSEKKKIDIDVRIMETQFVNIFTKIWAISEHWSSETVSLPFQAKGERDPAWFWIRRQTCCWKLGVLDCSK